MTIFSILKKIFLVAAVVLLLYLAVRPAITPVSPMTSNNGPMTASPSPMASNEARMPASPASEETWLRLPELHPSATQADVGAEIYRLVCQDCHGDLGQGLTPDWIAQWNPADQNCWQSHCHHPNHPPEGFILPRYIPGIIGPGTLGRFQTAQDLQQFISVSMPWHNPGVLTQEEYWQLTAYLLRENGIIPDGLTLDESQAAAVLLSDRP